MQQKQLSLLHQTHLDDSQLGILSESRSKVTGSVSDQVKCRERQLSEEEARRL